MLLYQVDSFTNKAFSGNPAGVCILDVFPSDELMQQIAAEMNLSETAFVVKNGSVWDIRYFTPRAEVVLCGHATLASAHCLYENRIVSSNESISFEAKGGSLRVEKQDNWLSMDFPEYPFEAIDQLAEFEEITGISAQALYASTGGWVMAHLSSEAEVAQAKPRFDAMRDSKFNHIMITAWASSSPCDYVLRCFAPIYGINEDPVTGVAECLLAPFWHRQTGKTRFMVQQLSPRGGVKQVSYNKPRVIIAGQAITMFSITLHTI